MHIIMAIAKTSHSGDEADRVNLPAWSNFTHRRGRDRARTWGDVHPRVPAP